MWGGVSLSQLFGKMCIWNVDIWENIVLRSIVFNILNKL